MSDYDADYDDYGDPYPNIGPGPQTVYVECRDCHRTFGITVDPDKFVAWREGELIQRAMPELSLAERELLISGTCGDCFDKIFPPDEDE